MNNCGRIFRIFRLRYGLSQAAFAALFGVPQRRLAAWERGEEEPADEHVLRLVDLTQNLPSDLLGRLAASVVDCELPRALSRSFRLNLRAISGPAVDKRPSIVDLVGHDLLPFACGVLRSMLDDRTLQRAITRREVAGVVATTRSVLRTAETEDIGTWRTTIYYCVHDGVIYSDAVAVPASAGEPIGYTPIMVDEIGSDLFGDRALLEASMAACQARPPRAARG